MPERFQSVLFLVIKQGVRKSFKLKGSLINLSMNFRVTISESISEFDSLVQNLISRTLLWIFVNRWSAGRPGISALSLAGRPRGSSSSGGGLWGFLYSRRLSPPCSHLPLGLCRSHTSTDFLAEGTDFLTNCWLIPTPSVHKSWGCWTSCPPPRMYFGGTSCQWSF